MREKKKGEMMEEGRVRRKGKWEGKGKRESRKEKIEIGREK